MLLTPATPAPGEPGAYTCLYGGSRRDTEPTGTLPLRFGFILKGCVLADGTGQRWTFTTLPQLDIIGTFTTTDSTSTNVNVVSGTLRVESGTVRGTCRIDVVMNFNARTFSFKQSGTYCGQAVDATWKYASPPN